MNTAIIVAAGSGQRFGSAQLKQFFPILGKPLIIHTLEQFEACPDVDEIVLVVSEAGRDEFERIEQRSDIRKLKVIVIGGTTRAESVRNGLDAVDAAANVVAVHDGARPLVTVDEISRTITKANETGAACLVGEVIDTIKQVGNDIIIRTIERSQLRRALTPQAFKYEILRKTFDGADLSENVTDECYLVEKMGVDIAIVEGSGRNIKVTRPEDVVLAEAFLKEA